MRKIVTIVLISICIKAAAQQAVPVKEEQRHMVKIRNHSITLMDARIAPGDTTLFHIHEVPSVFLIMSNTRVKTEVIGTDPYPSLDWKGTSFYNDFSEKLVHRVWNVDTSLFRAIDIELNNEPKVKNPAPIKGLNTFMDYSQVRSYALKLDPSSTRDIWLNNNPAVIIIYSGNLFIQANNKTEIIADGDFKWLEGNGNWRLMNAAHAPVKGYVFEIKR